MCSRRLKQAAYGPKIRRIFPLDGCACMITSRMFTLRYMLHLCLYEQRRKEADIKLVAALAYLTLKAPITTAADDNFFNIFPNFRKNKVTDDSHEIPCLICYF